MYMDVLYCYDVKAEDIDEFLQYWIDLGEEGVIVCDLGADWVAGHKGWRKMKKVRGVDYDLICTGAEEGKGKFQGLVANLFFKWKDGKTIKCSLGKGWTHDMVREMWQDYMIGGTGNPIGCIFQVYALEESSKGKLRLPKFGELRHDKVDSDV